MGYINYKLLYEKGLNDREFHLLQKIFQKESILLEPSTDSFKRLENMGLIQYIKGEKKLAKSVRISKKGKAFMSQLETMDYTDSTGKLVDALIGLYEASNKHVGTKLEVQNRLIWFIAQTGFSGTVIFNSVEEYLTDNPEYTKSLENLIWTPSSKAFSVHKNLKDSKLYDFICKKYSLDQSFFIDGKKTQIIKWYSSVASLEVFKRMKEGLYFSGSYDTDLKHIEKLKKLYLKEIKS